MAHNKLTKVTTVNFPPKKNTTKVNFLEKIKFFGEYGPNLAQNYKTKCSRNF